MIGAVDVCGQSLLSVESTREALATERAVPVTIMSLALLLLLLLLFLSSTLPLLLHILSLIIIVVQASCYNSNCHR
jgi:hypothetical protein